MSMNARDEFGDRMKLYEAQETGRYFMPLAPLYARLDGKSFHTFTKGMGRPYDYNFACVMSEVTRYLVQETGAILGYTQSDEISLAWLQEDIKSQMMFNRRIFKLTSVLAGMASSKFAILGMSVWSERVMRQTPCFDARVYCLPSEVELANCFLWREQDASKNAISMAAQAQYSHKELHQKSGPDKRAMLLEKGIDFEAYPAFFRRGRYLRRELRMVPLPEEARLRIPDGKRPPAGHLVQRSSIEVADLPPLGSLTNRCDVLFRGALPEWVTSPETSYEE